MPRYYRLPATLDHLGDDDVLLPQVQADQHGLRSGNPGDSGTAAAEGTAPPLAGDPMYGFSHCCATIATAFAPPAMCGAPRLRVVLQRRSGHLALSTAGPTSAPPRGGDVLSFLDLERLSGRSLDTATDELAAIDWVADSAPTAAADGRLDGHSALAWLFKTPRTDRDGDERRTGASSWVKADAGRVWLRQQRDIEQLLGLDAAPGQLPCGDRLGHAICVGGHLVQCSLPRALTRTARSLASLMEAAAGMESAPRVLRLPVNDGFLHSNADGLRQGTPQFQSTPRYMDLWISLGGSPSCWIAILVALYHEQPTDLRKQTARKATVEPAADCQQRWSAALGQAVRNLERQADQLAAHCPTDRYSQWCTRLAASVDPTSGVLAYGTGPVRQLHRGGNSGFMSFAASPLRSRTATHDSCLTQLLQAGSRGKLIHEAVVAANSIFTALSDANPCALALTAEHMVKSALPTRRFGVVASQLVRSIIVALPPKAAVSPMEPKRGASTRVIHLVATAALWPDHRVAAVLVTICPLGYPTPQQLAWFRSMLFID